MKKLLLVALALLPLATEAQTRDPLPWASGKPCKTDTECREIAQKLNDPTTYICAEVTSFCVKGCRKDSDCKSGEQCHPQTSCKGKKGCHKVCYQEAKVSSTPGPEACIYPPGNTQPLWARR